MKKLHLFIIAILFTIFGACNSTNNPQNNISNNDSLATGIFKFDTCIFNFGKILEGEQVSTEFKFTNVGNADIIISKVETSCGCTIPEYDKKPVAPGNVGTIRVRFDSSNKSGTQYKTIKLFSNCKDNEIFELVITGEVQDQE
ncbi:MAG: DUF1573 domain-containing protein [Bacteroidales bacterium]|nr:DUF1573 domain-containing protein [Bacteroidales bacterium]